MTSKHKKTAAEDTTGHTPVDPAPRPGPLGNRNPPTEAELIAAHAEAAYRPKPKAKAHA